MKKVIMAMPLLFLLQTLPANAQGSEEQSIRLQTSEFTRGIVAGDLTAVEKVFDPDPSNVFYDINEQMIGFARMRQVWQAAITNYKITRFEFGSDMKIQIAGNEAVQTGSWQQTQQASNGTSRQVAGRATILWKKSPSGWRVYHYHASVTPLRGGRG